METLFVVLSLNVRRGSSKEIWPLRRFFTVSLILADFNPVKLGVKNVKSVLIKNLGQKMEINIVEMNARLY